MFFLCFSSEDHSYPLNKQIINLSIGFPASGKTNNIGQGTFISQRDTMTVIAAGFQNELMFNSVIINDHIKWLKR